MILAANRCRDRSPNVYIADSIAEVSGILNPRLGDVVWVLSDGDNVSYRLVDEDLEPDGSNVIESNSCSYVWKKSEVGAAPISATAFGASTDSEDNSAALQMAFDMAGQFHPVVFPEGTFNILSGLTFQSGQVFIGVGGPQTQSGQTVIKAGGSGAFDILSPQNPTTDTINVKMSGLYLEGNGNTTVGLNLYRTSYSHFWSMNTILCEVGVLLDANVVNQCYFNQFYGCKFAYNTVVNIRFQRGANVNKFWGTWTGGAPRSIEFLTSSSGNVLTACDLQGVGAPNPTTTHVYADSAVNKLVACFIEAASVGIEETTNGRVEEIATTWGGNVTTRIIPNPTLAIAGLRLATIPISGDIGFRGKLGSLELSNDPNGANNSYFFTLPVRTGTSLGQVIWNITGGATGALRHLFQKDGSTKIFLDMLTSDVVINDSFGHFTLSDVRMARSAAATMELQALSGGSWRSGIKVDASTAAGETRLFVYDVNTNIQQRVKVGANGTGPGGVGRALYIDNV